MNEKKPMIYILALQDGKNVLSQEILLSHFYYDSCYTMYKKDIDERVKYYYFAMFQVLLSDGLMNAN